MKRLFVAFLLCALAQPAFAVDTDGDGLLDLIDVPGFDPGATGDVFFFERGVEDLDGASLLTRAMSLSFTSNRIAGIEKGDFQGLDNLQGLSFWDNRIASLENQAFEGLGNLQFLELDVNQISNIETGTFQGLANLNYLGLGQNQITTIAKGGFQGLKSLHTLDLAYNPITTIQHGDLDGLENLQELSLFSGQLTSIESGGFAGLENLDSLYLRDNQITRFEDGAFYGLKALRKLYLQGNPFTELNLTHATFDALDPCDSLGFCIGDSSPMTHLILDDAELSYRSFSVIIGETTSISHVSLVGLRFSDELPTTLYKLLTIGSLDHVRVDASLYNRYATEFNAFDSLPGNTVTVVPVPEPPSLVLLAAGAAGLAMRQRKRAKTKQN